MINLKPCPFCGGKAKFKLIDTWVIDTWKAEPKYVVCCENCSTNTRIYPAMSKAVEAWNTRHNASGESTEWISVNDSMPTMENYMYSYSYDVLVTDGDNVFIAWFDFEEGKWDSASEISNVKITHWSPIPTPPMKKAIADDTEIQFECNKCYAKFTQVFAKCGYMDGKAAAICPKCHAISKQLGD
ncbi:MAG: Lar family restriction alleviation protein [Methanobrevibacter sp.]|nr:Lar family restriction alleviation protein [Methanobrevibacter sp.]